MPGPGGLTPTCRGTDLTGGEEMMFESVNVNVLMLCVYTCGVETFDGLVQITKMLEIKKYMYRNVIKNTRYTYSIYTLDTSQVLVNK